MSTVNLRFIVGDDYAAGLPFRNAIVTGPGSLHIPLDDPPPVR